MDNIKIINGDLEFLCTDLSELEGFEEPTTRDVFIDPPEREGSLFINEVAGMRQFSWRGLIRTDIQATRQRLARICQPGGLKLLKFSLCDGTDVQIEATLKLLSAYSEKVCVYLISAKAPSPYFVSQVLHSEETGVTLQRGGLPIPAAIPAPIGGGTGNPFVIANLGDTVTHPNFTITGPGNNFLVQNLDTGESFRLNLNLAINEVVSINTVTNEVTKGEQVVFGSIERNPVGTWVTLQPQGNRIVFAPVSGSTPATRLRVEWRDTYAGF